ncbi:RNB domain-containing ribonuclease [Calidifontibacter terrae]
MVKRVISIRPATDEPSDRVDSPELKAAFDGLRQRLELPTDYPADAVREAEAKSANPPLPDRDETAVPFFTIDPEGSKDLDQAMCLERDGDGYRVRYAIANVPAFVEPGGALDTETHHRGQTIYLPDARIPLHPTVMSEGAASLLEGAVRGAFVWDFRLNASGEVTASEVYLAKVKSIARLDYTGVQGSIDDGSADERLLLLKEIGEKRITLEQARGGANLPMPEQEIHPKGTGYDLTLRPPVPAEDWNAQISLMTGMAAAEMMLHNQIGILRTMPPPDTHAITSFKRAAQALGAEWRADLTYGEFLRTLDRNDPRQLALIYEATSLFRGAGYTCFDGDIPEVTEQAAVAAPYAHVTAPLRRLVDRFGLVICEALSRDAEVPAWVRTALAHLPEEMKKSDEAARSAERAATDVVEAAFLSTHVGETFQAAVVDNNGKAGILVQLTDHAVIANVAGQAELGSTVSVRLESADIAAGKVQFVLA